MSRYSDVWCGASDDTGMDGSSCGYAHFYGCSKCGQESCKDYIKPLVITEKTNPKIEGGLELEVKKSFLHKVKGLFNKA